MRIDLFELVDGFFKGIVYFFYNIAETVFQLARNPIHGPIRLQHRHQLANVRQLGGLTFLFLSFFALFAVHFTTRKVMDQDGPEQGTSASETMGTSLVGAPDFDDSWLWLVFAATLASTVVLDSILRVALTAGLRRRRQRRALVLGAVEYALSWPLLLLTALIVLWPDRALEIGFQIFGLTGGLGAPTDRWSLALIPALLLTLIPAAVLLGAGLRPISRTVRRRSPLIVPAVLAGLAAAFALGTGTGGLVGSRINNAQERESYHAAYRDLRILDVQCERLGSSLQINAIIWNRGREALVHREGQYALLIGSLVVPELRGEARRFELSFADPPGLRILLKPGEAREVRFAARDYQYVPSDAGSDCGLMFEAGGGAENPLIWGQVPPPAPQ